MELRFISLLNLTGCAAFNSRDFKSLKEEQKKKLKFKGVAKISKEAKSFVRRMLEYIPENRPDYTELLSMEFLSINQRQKI